MWYKNRSVIGPKRHATRLIKKQCDSTPTGNVKYTSAIYDIDLKGEIVKRSLGTYSTYAKASKVCDRACMLRDYPSSVAQNPPNSSKRRQSNQHNFRRNLSSKNGRDGVVGPTHLNVVVVSERFCGISHRDRVQSVYNAILPAFCTNMENSERIMFGSRRMNKYGTVGKHVLSLQLFMHLRSNLCSHLLLDLRAPSQHSFHLESKVPNTDNGAGSLDQFIHQLIQPSILREIVNHSTSTTAPREENSHPFGHFFHDMKKEAKQLVMSEYKTNLNMINGDKRVLEKNSYLRKVIRAGHVKVVANEVLSVDKRSSKSGVGNKSFFARLGDTSIWQVSSAQSNVSDEILMQYDLLMNRITHHVLRIQRLYRFHYFHRTQRKWYNRHRAALMLQRVWKGSRGRSSVKLFRKQLALAPGVIQSLWRGYQGRREASQLRAALTKAASKMQPIVRGMIARKYFDWLVSNKAFATAIQRIARGYISRCKVKQLQFVKLAMLHDASAVMIQMCARIWMSKLVFSKRKWHVFVVVPSVIMIQSYWRKHTSRTISGAKQRTRNAIIRMQAWIRGFLHRGRIRSFVEKRSRRLSAIKIQSHARRWISQEFSERAMARRYHKFVVVPSAVMIQTRYRCYFYENALFKRKSRWKSTISIQSEFRRWTSTRLLGRLRQQERCRFLNQVSTKIQANYRGYRARYMFESLKTNAISRRVYASRVILRAWIRYKSMLQHHAWKDMWILSRGKAALMSIGKEKQDTIFDLEQVSRDIASRRKIIGVADLKLKETKAFITQAYARRELVQVELESLETDAKSDDLSELLDNEIFVLSNKISMARQHLQHSKIQLGRAKVRVFYRAIFLLWFYYSDD